MAELAAKLNQSADEGEVVSNESEQLILVDANDQEVGYRSKAACHDDDGMLHRAFSLFVFNSAGQLLLQRRAADKRLWPMFWSNSCCSHPRKGEDMHEAVDRRLWQELRIRSDLDFLYKFQYQAEYIDLGTERELCWVFAGVSDEPVRANRTEVADWRFVDPHELDRELNQHPEWFTPWFKLEWPIVKTRYSPARSRLEALLSESRRELTVKNGTGI